MVAQGPPGPARGLPGGLIGAVAGGIAWSGGEGGVIGLVLWALGGVWLAASARQLLSPAFVGLVLGAALTLAAAGVTSSQWNDFGVLFGLATAGALVGVGIRADLFPVTGVGVLGSFFYLPATLGNFFEGTIGVPAVMLLSGLALLVLTMWLLQHRSAGHPPRPSLT